MTLPSIRLTERELTSGTLEPSTRLLARQVFAKRGLIIIENAYAPELMARLREALMFRYSGIISNDEHRLTLMVGDKRFMVPVEISGPFNSPEIYAHPLLLAVVEDALGSDFILGSFGAVVAHPGASDQHVHRDHPFLFNNEAVDMLLPAYAVNVIVPLVTINGYQGTTRVWPGSHRVWEDSKARSLPAGEVIAEPGSCILLDYRLLHGGTANHAPQLRPILYMTYQRPWFRDYANFQKVRELTIPVRELECVPDAYKRWFVQPFTADF